MGKISWNYCCMGNRGIWAKADLDGQIALNGVFEMGYTTRFQENIEAVDNWAKIYNPHPIWGLGSWSKSRIELPLWEFWKHKTYLTNLHEISKAKNYQATQWLHFFHMSYYPAPSSCDAY